MNACSRERDGGRGKELTANGASLVRRVDALSAGVACTAHLRQYSSHAGRERGRGKTRGANVKMPAAEPSVLTAFPAPTSFEPPRLLSCIHFQTSIRARYLGNFRRKLAHSLLTANTHAAVSLSLPLLLSTSLLPFRVSYSSRTGFYLSRARRDRRRFALGQLLTARQQVDRDTARTARCPRTTRHGGNAGVKHLKRDTRHSVTGTRRISPTAKQRTDSSARVSKSN